MALLFDKDGNPQNVPDGQEEQALASGLRLERPDGKVEVTTSTGDRYAMPMESAREFLADGSARLTSFEELNRERRLEQLDAENGMSAVSAFGRSASLGASDYATVALGTDKEELALRAEANKGEFLETLATVGGYVSGGFALSALTGGAGAMIGRSALGARAAAAVEGTKLGTLAAGTTGKAIGMFAAERGVDFVQDAAASVNQDWLVDREISAERAIVAGGEGALMGMLLQGGVATAGKAAAATAAGARKAGAAIGSFATGGRTAREMAADAVTNGFSKADKAVAQKLGGDHGALGDYVMGQNSTGKPLLGKNSAETLANVEADLEATGASLGEQAAVFDNIAQNTAKPVNVSLIAGRVRSKLDELRTAAPGMADQIETTLAPVLDGLVDESSVLRKASDVTKQDWWIDEMTSKGGRKVSARLEQLESLKPRAGEKVSDFLDREVGPVVAVEARNADKAIAEFEAHVQSIRELEAQAERTMLPSEVWDLRKRMDQIQKTLDRTSQAPLFSQLLEVRGELVSATNEAFEEIAGKELVDKWRDTAGRYLKGSVAKEGLIPQVQKVQRLSGEAGLTAIPGAVQGAVMGGLMTGSPMTGAAIGAVGSLVSTGGARVADMARQMMPRLPAFVEATTGLLGPAFERVPGGKAVRAAGRAAAEAGQAAISTTGLSAMRRAYKAADLQQRREELEASLQDHSPEQVAALTSDSELGGDIDAARQRIAKGLLDEMPKPLNQQGPFGKFKEPIYAAGAVERFSRFEGAVLRPDETMRRIADGTAREDELRALAMAYPSSFERIRQQAIARAANTLTPPTEREMNVIRKLIGVLPHQAQLGSWAQQVSQAAGLVPPSAPPTPGGGSPPPATGAQLDAYGGYAGASDRLSQGIGR